MAGAARDRLNDGIDGGAHADPVPTRMSIPLVAERVEGRIRAFTIRACTIEAESLVRRKLHG